jgi:hypothetical protein
VAALGSPSAGPARDGSGLCASRFFARSSGRSGLQHFADVVKRCGGADVAAQDGEVLVAGDVGDLVLLDAGGRGRGRIPSAQRVPGELLGSSPAALARRLTINAIDWPVSRSAPTVSPRRIRRNTGPRWIPAACSHARSAWTAR